MGGQPGKVGAAMMLPHMGQPRPAIQPRPGYQPQPMPLPTPGMGTNQPPTQQPFMPRSGGGKGGQPMPRPGMQPQPGMMPPADQPSPVMEPQPDVMPPAGQPGPVVGPDASRSRWGGAISKARPAVGYYDDSGQFRHGMNPNKPSNPTSAGGK